jgi:hypothetical protein
MYAVLNVQLQFQRSAACSHCDRSELLHVIPGVHHTGFMYMLVRR